MQSTLKPWLLRRHVICKTEGKESVKTQKDRISELPDDILSSILSYLTLRDAANTSLLSSRWRHLCASISILDFNLKTMFGKDINRNTKSDDGIHVCHQYKDRFVQGVNQFLRYYEGSRLVRFYVSLCLNIDSTCDIDQWVSFALNRGVEHLFLGLSCVYRCKKDRIFYLLRSELFSHPNTAKIRALFLNSCILESGVIDQFSSIKALTLVNMCLTEETLENILTCCLNLETMIFSSCTLPLKLCISGSPHQLKFLAVLLCVNLEEIKLSHTNLVTFEYAGHMISFSFSRVPNLEKVFFRALDGKGFQYVFSQLAKDLPLLRNLSVFSKLNWVQHLPKDMATFDNVKILELTSDQRGKFDMLKIIIILRACPLLEKLYLNLNCTVCIEEGTELDTKMVHEHLKEVHISRFLCLRFYLEFAIYMVEYAAALEKLVISPKLLMYIGGLQWGGNNETWDEARRRLVHESLKDYLKSAELIIQ